MLSDGSKIKFFTDFSFHIFSLSSLSLFLLRGSMTSQPAPASAGEESEEDQQFRTIFQEIAGEVSTKPSMTSPSGKFCVLSE